ncbi:hypothetical protein RI367_001880 [Sorochytrium milnesiophthora]
MPIVELMLLKKEAKGEPAVRPDTRSFHRVQFDPALNRQPIAMFFDKTWKVGRVLDSVCRTVGIDLEAQQRQGHTLLVATADTAEAWPLDRRWDSVAADAQSILIQRQS